MQYCARRDFLLKTLATAGLAALPAEFLAAVPPPVKPGAIGDKRGAVMVRLVYALFDEVQKRKTWPNIGFDFRPILKNIADTLNAKIPGVEFLPVRVFDREGVKNLLKEDAERGIAGYMVIQMNSWPDAAVPLAELSEKPLLFCSFPYSGIGGWCTGNAAILRSGRKGYGFLSSMEFDDMVGIAAAFAELKNGGVEDFQRVADAFRLAHTPQEMSVKEPKEGALKCLSPEATIAKLKGMKILALEKPAIYFMQKGNIARDFGIEVVDVPFGDLDRLWAACTEARAKPLFDSWKNGARAVIKVDDETLMGCARMYFAMLDLLKERGAQAITVDCLGGCYQGKLHAYPCLGFMELQDHGLFGVCEADLRSTLTMMVMSAMTGGRMGYVSDPAIDSSRRAIVYAHCVSTRRFFGVDDKPVPYEILTHAEDLEGASVRAIAPVGYPITTVEIWPEKEAVVVHSGVTIGNDPDDRACRTKIITEVKGDFERLYRHWDTWGWHRVSVYGDCREGIVALAKHLGYRIDEES